MTVLDFFEYWFDIYGITYNVECFYFTDDGTNTPYDPEFEIEDSNYLSFRVYEDQLEDVEKIVCCISNLINARYAFKGELALDGSLVNLEKCL